MNLELVQEYLNKIDCNTEVCLQYERTKHIDSIVLNASNFTLMVDEYSGCSFEIHNVDKWFFKDKGVWLMVKQWMRDYFKAVL